MRRSPIFLTYFLAAILVAVTSLAIRNVDARYDTTRDETQQRSQGIWSEIVSRHFLVVLNGYYTHAEACERLAPLLSIVENSLDLRIRVIKRHHAHATSHQLVAEESRFDERDADSRERVDDEEKGAEEEELPSDFVLIHVGSSADPKVAALSSRIAAALTLSQLENILRSNDHDHLVRYVIHERKYHAPPSNIGESDSGDATETKATIRRECQCQCDATNDEGASSDDDDSEGEFSENGEQLDGRYVDESLGAMQVGDTLAEESPNVEPHVTTTSDCTCGAGRGGAKESRRGDIGSNDDDDDPLGDADDLAHRSWSTARRLHKNLKEQQSLPSRLSADLLWEQHVTGRGVRVAVFDTGLSGDHPHFRYVRERTDWTGEMTLDDQLGHGTFVSGVIAGQSESCPGFAPDVELFSYRVFTNDKISFTSWFLDAFNHAIARGINVLNLSIGGPDFADRPFVEKVWEMSANNIIVVSAIGNDGPRAGTLNNPADMLDVIGVGGVDFKGRVASFSSRGMTTWELPRGYGRVKPDVVAYGKKVPGSRLYSGCRTLSGTSVASPVVAGAVALLVSSVPIPLRQQIVNPASIKQVLIESAYRLPPPAMMFEQGSGRLNLLGAFKLLSNYEPRASFHPPMYDLTDCPYMWPYCTQPMYWSGMPTMLNVTVLNGMGVTGTLVDGPRWVGGRNGDLVEFAFDLPDVLWPYTGYIGIRMRVTKAGRSFSGMVDGVVSVTVRSPPAMGERTFRETKLELPIRVAIEPTPPRNKRLLFDLFHNLRYPPGYLPRDSLRDKEDPFDWNGDHVHTNLMGWYTHLRQEGYFVEVLGEPWTCFDAKNYGALILYDLEDEFFTGEISKLQTDINERGLNVLVLADWFEADVIQEVRFFDENTNQWWDAATGGSNIPALNDLLTHWGIELGAGALDGRWTEVDQPLSKIDAPDSQSANWDVFFDGGVALRKFPVGGYVRVVPLYDVAPEIMDTGERKKVYVAPVGLVRVVDIPQFKDRADSGRIAIMGDSSCVDDAHYVDGKKVDSCFESVGQLLAFVVDGRLPTVSIMTNPRVEGEYLKSEKFIPAVELQVPLTSEYFNDDAAKEAERFEPQRLAKLSRVMGRSLDLCESASDVYFASEPDRVELNWDELRLNHVGGQAPSPTSTGPAARQTTKGTRRPSLASDGSHNLLFVAIPIFLAGSCLVLFWVLFRGASSTGGSGSTTSGPVGANSPTSSGSSQSQQRAAAMAKIRRR